MGDLEFERRGIEGHWESPSCASNMAGGNDSPSSSKSAARAAVQAMAMEGSASEDSYAQNSAMQNRNFHAIARPRLEKAIAHLMMHSRREAKGGKQQLAMADLGCSYGRNTIDCALFILQTLRSYIMQRTTAKHNIAEREAEATAREKEDEDEADAEEAAEEEADMEVQYFFSDLPSNDFNALFLALDALQRPRTQNDQQLNHQIRMDGHLKMYAAGVPGSFYGRLFPSGSLDFVVCSYSLHWLSQVFFKIEVML
ncbi:hypothetical protein GOP47_0003783 [Adiantum capillus-veneris]|uniref:Uncharacterized protein n=1 Tax=Adiantum capillus-veneris TaxID=13818 RepID=A0A9D4V6Y3_ADICA|nr:hypothetical protein GOP47_0003783 [Adiantum capillus-veneris]